MPSPEDLKRNFTEQLREEQKQLISKEIQNKLWKLQEERDKLTVKLKSNQQLLSETLTKLGCAQVSGNDRIEIRTAFSQVIRFVFDNGKFINVEVH